MSGKITGVDRVRIALERSLAELEESVREGNHLGVLANSVGYRINRGLLPEGSDTTRYDARYNQIIGAYKGINADFVRLEL